MERKGTRRQVRKTRKLNKSKKASKLDFSRLELSDEVVEEELNKMTNLPRIDDAYFYNNNMSVVPLSLSRCINLTGLELQNNHITSFERVCALPNLINLYLQKNNIVKCARSISKLTNLQFLHLGKNQIKFIPKELCTLKNLKVSVLYAQVSLTLFCGRLYCCIQTTFR